MRWFVYFILAYVAVGIQVGAGTYLSYKGAAPNLVLLAVIFIAINAPRDAALLGGFCMGAMWDLLSQEPLGLYAVCFGLVALFVSATQSIVYREHPLTHFTLALIGGGVVAVLVTLHALIRSPEVVRTIQTTGAALATPRRPLLPAYTSALYTAALAPFLISMMHKMRRLFAFEAPRRKVRF